MLHIAKTGAPIQAVVHYPQTEEGRHELSTRVAGVHADFVLQSIKGLTCPSEQKLQLLNAVIRSVKAEAEQTSESHL